MKKSLILVTLFLVFALLFCGCAQDTAILANETVDETPDEEPEAEHQCDLDHDHYPFEWSGEISFSAGLYNLKFEESGDPSIEIIFISSEGNLEDSEIFAHHVWEAEKELVEAGESFTALYDYGYKLMLDPEGTSFTFEVIEAGDYLVFTEHLPEEFQMQITNLDGEMLTPNWDKEYEGHDHDH